MIFRLILQTFCEWAGGGRVGLFVPTADLRVFPPVSAGLGWHTFKKKTADVGVHANETIDDLCRCDVACCLQ